jgi:hypothetical protein
MSPGGFGPPGGFNPGGTAATPKKEDDEFLIKRRKRERLAIKAQATSWALYYYLTMSRPTELKAYLAELAAMPRDVPLGAAAAAAFGRAFHLDGSRESLEKFAHTWLDYMHNITPMGIDVTLIEPKPAAPTSSMPMPPGMNKQ